jgi:TPR repeat protein
VLRADSWLRRNPPFVNTRYHNGIKMKRILIIAGVTAVCFLIAAACLFFRSTADGPVPPAPPPPPAIDVAALKAKAEQGDTQAQTQLGKAFAEGQGVPRDYKQAARWYGQAASNGNVEAEAMFGELCQAGQGVHHDITNALKWFTKAAQQGSTTAQYDLGFMYERGQGVPHDEKLAAHWYQLAAEGGDALAQFDYGQRCFIGLGVALDQVEGLKWMFVAAAQGQTDSGKRAEVEQKKMTSDQIAEAKRRAAAFTPRGAGALNKP